MFEWSENEGFEPGIRFGLVKKYENDEKWKETTDDFGVDCSPVYANAGRTGDGRNRLTAIR